MNIDDNDIPGQPFDYDVKVSPRNTKASYRHGYSQPSCIKNPKQSVNGFLVFVILLFGAICFGLGVSVGSPDGQDARSSVPSVLEAVPTATQTVTVDKPVPAYPPSCTMAFDVIAKMYPDLEIIIDSSQRQIMINNQSYVAIVSKDTQGLTQATSDQYDLNRSVSHSTLQLQDMLANLQPQLNQCKADLGR